MSSFDDRIRNIYVNLRNSFPNTSSNFAILKIAINANNDHLKNIYQQKVETHNSAILDNIFADSGFDLFVPENIVFDRDVDTKFIDFQLKAEMVYCNITNDNYRTCAFYIYPRSSISKTPLMLANNTGIIDSGYRGSLIGAFRWLRTNSDNYTVEQNTRLVQICHPSLCPIYVVLVNEEDLSSTERGDGGFGSTGI
jgi:dUTP pyrophosphatase